MKRQGSMLIEVLASVMILTLTSTFIISTSIENFNTLKKRVLQENVNRTINNLENEFKYNISKEEIYEMLNDSEVGFKYDQDFCNKLSYENIKEFEDGEDIIVSKISDDDVGLNLKIVANIKIEKNEVNLEKEFTKSWWMDEV